MLMPEGTSTGMTIVSIPLIWDGTILGGIAFWSTNMTIFLAESTVPLAFNFLPLRVVTNSGTAIMRWKSSLRFMAGNVTPSSPFRV